MGMKDLNKKLEKVKISIRYFRVEYEDTERHYLRAKEHMDNLVKQRSDIEDKIRKVQNV
jgi:hypothetical protein